MPHTNSDLRETAPPHRRTVLLGAAALPMASAVASPGWTGGHDGTTLAMPQARGFKLGAMEVTTLLSGAVVRDGPQEIFGTTVSAETFARVSAANFISATSLQFYYTPTVVRAGGAVVLFDTGLSAASLLGPLSAAGLTQADITHVVITHMHPDHIGGMTTDTGELAYHNASFVTGQVEFDVWSGLESADFDAKVRPFADRFRFVRDGDAVVPGVTALETFGHTPGHMSYHLESEGQQLLLVADLVGHYVWSFANPDWDMRYDSDKAAANATRRRILDLLATDKMPMIGYHMPFPAAGYVERRADSGFRFVPVSYQFAG